MFKLSFNIVNSALTDVFIGHFLFHGTSGAKYTYCHCSSSFLLIQLCSNVYYCFYLCFGRQLRRFEAKEFIFLKPESRRYDSVYSVFTGMGEGHYTQTKKNMHICVRSS